MSTIDDIKLLETIEKYLAGEMSNAEFEQFELTRKSTPEIDQMVVEHGMFLNAMDNYAARKNFSKINEITFNTLFEAGEWAPLNEQSSKFKLIKLWNKYKKVTAIAASVGGIIALFTTFMTIYFSPTLNGSQVMQLSKQVEIIKNNQLEQGNILNEVKTKMPQNAILVSGGTGFLINQKGYMITSAHVLKGDKVMVINNEGQEFNAEIVYSDIKSDLSLLKINDTDYIAPKYMPYSIDKKMSDLSEEVFTLGYPRNDNDIVYGKGYLSAQTGFEGDKNAYQIQIGANPGYSGAPVFNEKNEIIGVINTRQKQLEGVTFAIKSAKIYDLINEVETKSGKENKIEFSKKVSSEQDKKKTINNMKGYIFNIRSFN